MKAKKTVRTRYYVHGDQTEFDPKLFYCQACDLFRERDHFGDGKHPYMKQSDFELYLYRKELFRKAPKRFRDKYYRPADAVNIV